MTCKLILKILMIVFNGAIFFAGIGIVIIGYLVKFATKPIFEVLEKIDEIPPELKQVISSSLLLIAVGAILACVGFLGGCGACCENKCMLITFFCVILIVFIMEITATLLILLKLPMTEKMLGTIRDNVTKSIKQNYNESTPFASVWNEMMKLMECCGYNNYTDFTDSPFEKVYNIYPHFCCTTKVVNCSIEAIISEQKNVQGCFDAVVNKIKSNSSPLAAVAVCAVGIEVAAMIMSLMLYKN